MGKPPANKHGRYRGRILILYFSGAGATKKVAQLMHLYLSQACAADIFSIEGCAGLNLNDYSALVIGTPVYHAAPPGIVTGYFDGLRPLVKATPALIYSTRGLCGLNTNRMLAKQLRAKNIITIMDTAYRSPASDGSLVAPGIKRFFEFEPDLKRKVARDCTTLLRLLQTRHLRGYIPRFQFGSIVNAPNKLAGRLIRLKIHLHRERCTKCCKCATNCPLGAVSKDASGWPVIAKAKCMNCYRCVHHCPGLALSLSKRRPPGRVLTY